MKNNKKEFIYSISVGIIFFCLSFMVWFNPSKDFSYTERRPLNQFPELSFTSIADGTFMEKFEDYTLDQFPFREEMRTLKALTHKYVFLQLDNNNVYLADGHISKLDYPYSSKAKENALKKFQSIYEKYIQDSDAKVYFSMIPDKNYFLAEDNGYLSIDYDTFYKDMEQTLHFMNYIEIRDLLTIDDYYYTDTHWRQENILDVAKRLAEEMGVTLNAEYETIELSSPFYGVYYGQLALPVDPDKIAYLNNPLFDDCIVFDYEHQKEIPVYDLNLATGKDPYEMYLSGSLSVITIENPNATTDKELVIFRDSFGSSIAPLFAETYQKITLLDIRYLNQNMIPNFVTFENQDVLFLYSTGVINNETAFH